MSLVLTRSQVREVDRKAIDDYGMSGLVLMENAGRGCVDVLLALGAKGPVVVACGKGNNGGDGFVIARHLDNHGVPVSVLLLADAAALAGDARANYEILRRTAVPIEHFTEPQLDAAAQREIQQRLQAAEWIVDALLGTGAVGPPREPFVTAIRLLDAAQRKLLAVDIPSGFDCDTGDAAEPTIRADHTCTFVALKPGLLQPCAAEFCGQIHIVDIGVPRKLLAEIVVEGDAS